MPAASISSPVPVPWAPWKKNGTMTAAARNGRASRSGGAGRRFDPGWNRRAAWVDPGGDESLHPDERPAPTFG
jgi:hypothetical protein